MKRTSAASQAARLLSKRGARKGGLASAASLTREERRDRGRVAATARWGADSVNDRTPRRRAGRITTTIESEPAFGTLDLGITSDMLDRAGLVAGDRVVLMRAADLQERLKRVQPGPAPRRKRT